MTTPIGQGIIEISEPQPSSAARLEQAFRRPDATQLSPLLRELRAHDDLDGIEQLGWKLADASPTQEEAIRTWLEPLPEQQKGAFEKGCVKRQALMLILGESPSYLDGDDFRNLFDTSHSVQDIVRKHNPKAWQAVEESVALPKAFSWVKHQGFDNDEDDDRTFDKLFARITSLPPGLTSRRILLGFIPNLSELDIDEWPDRFGSILALLPGMPPRFQVDCLIALIKVLTGTSPMRILGGELDVVHSKKRKLLPDDQGWNVLEKMKTLILSLKPEALEKEMLLAWAETAQLHTIRPLHSRARARELNEIRMALDAHQLPELETTMLKMAAMSVEYAVDFCLEDLSDEDTQKMLAQCLSRALKSTDQLHEKQAHHLQTVIGSIDRLRGNERMPVHDEVFREIQSVTSIKSQSDLLVRLMDTLRRVGLDLTEDVGERFLKAWDTLLSLNQGTLSPKDFLSIARTLEGMRVEHRSEGLAAVLECVKALQDPVLRKGALQILQECFHGKNPDDLPPGFLQQLSQAELNG